MFQQMSNPQEDLGWIEYASDYVNFCMDEDPGVSILRIQAVDESQRLAVMWSTVLVRTSVNTALYALWLLI